MTAVGFCAIWFCFCVFAVGRIGTCGPALVAVFALLAPVLCARLRTGKDGTCGCDLLPDLPPALLRALLLGRDGTVGCGLLAALGMPAALLWVLLFGRDGTLGLDFFAESDCGSSPSLSEDDDSDDEEESDDEDDEDEEEDEDDDAEEAAAGFAAMVEVRSASIQ